MFKLNCQVHGIFVYFPFEYYLIYGELCLKEKSLCLGNIGIEDQQAVLEATVSSTLCNKYPTSLSYRRAFVKYLIQKVSI